MQPTQDHEGANDEPQEPVGETEIPPLTPDPSPEQYLLRGAFFRRTGRLPVSDVQIIPRPVSRRAFAVCLAAWGRHPRKPLEPFALYVTPIRLRRRPSSKYIPDNNQGTGNCGDTPQVRRHGQQDDACHNASGGTD